MLRAVDEYYRAVTDFELQYVETVWLVDDLTRGWSAVGRLRVSRPLRFRIDRAAPRAATTVCDGTRVLYLNEPTSDAFYYEAAGRWWGHLGLVTGEASLERDFAISADGSDDRPGESCLRLEPLVGRRHIDHVRACVSMVGSERGAIMLVEEVRVNGRRVQWTFTSIERVEAFPPDTFSMMPPPGLVDRTAEREVFSARRRAAGDRVETD